VQGGGGGQPKREGRSEALAHHGGLQFHGSYREAGMFEGRFQGERISQQKRELWGGDEWEGVRIQTGKSTNLGGDLVRKKLGGEGGVAPFQSITLLCRRGVRKGKSTRGEKSLRAKKENNAREEDYIGARSQGLRKG